MFPSKSPPVPSTSSTTVYWIDATASAYGLSTSGTAAVNATALGLADAAALAAGKRLWIPKGSYSTTGVTFSSFVMMETGAIFVASSGTLAFNGGVEWDISPHLTLTGTATATFSKQKTTVGYAEWWGAVTNSAGTDCMAALNASILALTKTQLMPATYYTSGNVNNATNFNSLIGASLQYYGTTKSVICCTSSSATILTLWGHTYVGATKCNDVHLTRSVAPLISSNCIGLHVNGAYYAEIANIASFESMVGIKINGTVGNRISKCVVSRTVAGTGAVTDYFRGFWFDGLTVNPATGYAQGNASLYVDNCIVAPSALIAESPSGTVFSGTSTGYYFDGYYRDNFLRQVETYETTYGIVFVGGSAWTYTQDVQIIAPILEVAGSCLYVTNHVGNIHVNGGHMYARPSTLNAVYVHNSTGQVKLNAVEYVGNATATTPLIYVSSSENVSSTEGSILECPTAPVSLNSSNNCKFTDSVLNNTVTGSAVSITNSNRNIFEMRMNGTYARAKGYNVTDALSGYNEFNCTGIDPTCITGGSANKLVINGTQVVAVGIAAAGHGTNVASGVMA